MSDLKLLALVLLSGRPTFQGGGGLIFAPHGLTFLWPELLGTGRPPYWEVSGRFGKISGRFQGGFGKISGGFGEVLGGLW